MDMNTQDTDIPTLSQALVKEYLTAHGYASSLEAFKKELSSKPVTGTISSRREVAFHLGIKKQVERNKENESPLKSLLEVLADTVSTKVRMQRAGRSNNAPPPATQASKYIKSVTSEKIQGFMEMPQQISNSASSTRLPPPSSFRKSNSGSERRGSLVKDIEVIEDLDLSDSEDFEHSVASVSLGGGSASISEEQTIQFTSRHDQEILSVLFPSGVKEFSAEWTGKGFVFQNNKDLTYGLIQAKGGPCGLLAAAQAVILKNLTTSTALKTVTSEGFVRPSQTQSKLALLLSLTEMIWNTTKPSKKASLVLKSSERFASARLTSGYCFVEYGSKSDLQEGIAKHLGQFNHDENRGNGLIQFLLSAIVSRGASQVKDDMDEWSEALIGKHSYCTQEMVNLLLNGKAISNLHDGIMDLGGQKLKGLQSPCEIGQLSLFEHYDNLKIGSFGKNPRYPIFVVCSESHYTVLFGTMNACPNTQSTSSFILFYYDGLANQTHEIKLTLTPGGKKGKEMRDLIPPMELCLSTKWGKDLLVDWNDTEPLL